MTASTEVAMRDLSKAKEAYKKNDIEASIAAHENKHVEDHSKVGGHIKSIVFGGLDGRCLFTNILSCIFFLNIAHLSLQMKSTFIV
jgi:hypothetical protein